VLQLIFMKTALCNELRSIGHSFFTASEESPCIHGTRIFIVTFTWLCRWTLSSASWIQSIFSNPDCQKYSFTFDLRLGVQSGLFHSCFHIKILSAFFLPPMHASFPAYRISIDIITRTMSVDDKAL